MSTGTVQGIGDRLSPPCISVTCVCAGPRGDALPLLFARLRFKPPPLAGAIRGLLSDEMMVGKPEGACGSAVLSSMLVLVVVGAREAGTMASCHSARED